MHQSFDVLPETSNLRFPGQPERRRILRRPDEPTALYALSTLWRCHQSCYDPEQGRIRTSCAEMLAAFSHETRPTILSLTLDPHLKEAHCHDDALVLFPDRSAFVASSVGRDLWHILPIVLRLDTDDMTPFLEAADLGLQNPCSDEVVRTLDEVGFWGDVLRASPAPLERGEAAPPGLHSAWPSCFPSNDISFEARRVIQRRLDIAVQVIMARHAPAFLSLSAKVYSARPLQGGVSPARILHTQRSTKGFDLPHASEIRRQIAQIVFCKTAGLPEDALIGQLHHFDKKGLMHYHRIEIASSNSARPPSHHQRLKILEEFPDIARSNASSF